MRIVMGADPWGRELKDTVKAHLQTQGHEIIDIGMTDAKTEIPYYQVAATAAKKIQHGQAQCGILFCGTGMGVAIVANKFKGIAASVVESAFTARMCKAVNNANVLTMGAMVVAPHIATLAADAWLGTSHTEGLDQFADFLTGALNEIDAIEETNMT